jgi:hypothetical protein
MLIFVSQRYTGYNVVPNVQNLLQETQQECPNIRVLAADDFFCFDVQDRWNHKRNQISKNVACKE